MCPCVWVVVTTIVCRHVPDWQIVNGRPADRSGMPTDKALAGQFQHVATGMCGSICAHEWASSTIHAFSKCVVPILLASVSCRSCLPWY
jgi:hypothetical protein